MAIGFIQYRYIIPSGSHSKFKEIVYQIWKQYQDKKDEDSKTIDSIGTGSREDMKNEDMFEAFTACVLPVAYDHCFMLTIASYEVIEKKILNTGEAVDYSTTQIIAKSPANRVNEQADDNVLRSFLVPAGDIREDIDSKKIFKSEHKDIQDDLEHLFGLAGFDAPSGRGVNNKQCFWTYSELGKRYNKEKNRENNKGAHSKSK